MTGTQAARMWMLLQSERSLGLESVPWKLATQAVSAKPLPGPERPRMQTQAAAVTRPPLPPRPAAAPLALSPVSPPQAARTIAPRPVQPIQAFKGMPTHISDTIALPLAQRTSELEALNENHVKGCTKCSLSESRKNTVFGEGAADASLMFIGEGPGEDEDETGRPFVGRSGQLLGKMIAAMGLSREQVYIANVVKCRPPGNRTPAAEEVVACTPYLVKQIQIIRPKVIVTLGLPATQFILSTNQQMRDLRGNWHEWHGIKVMPTYHPSYVLRSYTPTVRGAVWSDLQKVMQELGMPLKAAEFTR